MRFKQLLNFRTNIEGNCTLFYILDVNIYYNKKASGYEFTYNVVSLTNKLSNLREKMIYKDCETEKKMLKWFRII